MCQWRLVYVKNWRPQPLLYLLSRTRQGARALTLDGVEPLDFVTSSRLRCRSFRRSAAPSVSAAGGTEYTTASSRLCGPTSVDTRARSRRTTCCSVGVATGVASCTSVSSGAFVRSQCGWTRVQPIAHADVRRHLDALAAQPQTRRLYLPVLPCCRLPSFGALRTLLSQRLVRL
jgi:hypothetical protein